jgi:hypothetical protein
MTRQEEIKQTLLSGSGNQQLGAVFASFRGVESIQKSYLNAERITHQCVNARWVGVALILVGSILLAVVTTTSPTGHSGLDRSISYFLLGAIGAGLLSWIGAELIRGLDTDVIFTDDLERKSWAFLDLFFGGADEQTSSPDELVAVVWSKLQEKVRTIKDIERTLASLATKPGVPPWTFQNLKDEASWIRRDISKMVDSAKDVGVLSAEYVYHHHCYEDLFSLKPVYASMKKN